MSDIRYLEVVFENCESIIIPTERVQSFRYDKLNPVSDVIVADSVFLEVKYLSSDELNYKTEDHGELLGVFIGNPVSNNVGDRPHILGRLINHRDIVLIKDRNMQGINSIYVAWHDADGYDNRYEVIEIGDQTISITIKK